MTEKEKKTTKKVTSTTQEKVAKPKDKASGVAGQVKAKPSQEPKTKPSKPTPKADAPVATVAEDTQTETSLRTTRRATVDDRLAKMTPKEVFALANKPCPRCGRSYNVNAKRMWIEVKNDDVPGGKQTICIHCSFQDRNQPKGFSVSGASRPD